MYGPTQNRTAVLSKSRICLSHWTMGPEKLDNKKYLNIITHTHFFYVQISAK